MRFDYTHGEKARYVVSVYGELVNDSYFFADYEKAKKMFGEISDEYTDKPNQRVIIAVWDIKKGEYLNRFALNEI